MIAKESAATTQTIARHDADAETGGDDSDNSDQWGDHRDYA